MIGMAAIAGGVMPPVAAQGRDMASLVHRLGGLMAQSQRLSKAYALIGLGIEAADARRVVNECLAASARTVEELLAAPLAASARATMAGMAQGWARARQQTLAEPTPKTLDALLVLDAQLLGMANEAVTQLLWQGVSPELKAVDTAGRMGMLSQRLAKYHFCALWGVVPRIAVTQMAKARDEFQLNLRALQTAARTAAQREAIAAASAQWVFFDAALQSSKQGAEAGVNTRLARASETMLLVFNDVAPKFARIS